MDATWAQSGTNLTQIKIQMKGDKSIISSVSQMKIHPEMHLPKIKDGKRSSPRTLFLPYVTQRPLPLSGKSFWVGQNFELGLDDFRYC